MRSRAAQRYTVRLLTSMATYVGVLFASLWYVRHYDPQGSLRVVLSILPAIPVLVAIGVILLYLAEETDEFLRNQAAKAMLLATGVLLSVATVVGMLQYTDIVGKVDVFWAFPIWCFAWGILQCGTMLRSLGREAA